MKPSSVVCCALRPKRPACPSALRFGRPEMPSPSASSGSARPMISSSGICATNPRPYTAGARISEIAVAPGGIPSGVNPISLADSMTTDWSRSPPWSGSVLQPSAGSNRLTLVTGSAPWPPLVGRSWQEPQRSWLKSGPRPSSGVKGRLKRAFPAPNASISAWSRPGSGNPGSVSVNGGGLQPSSRTASVGATPEATNHRIAVPSRPFR